MVLEKEIFKMPTAINGSKTIKFGSKEQFQKPIPKVVTAGPTVGESYSLFI